MVFIFKGVIGQKITFYFCIIK